MEDYKEKYNKLVKAVKVLQETNPSDEGLQNWVNDNVPELQESKDERIRKELIDAIQGLWDNDALPMPLSLKRKERWIAWLEKQGEQREQLINKACDVLVNCIEDYMLRRMEVWNEECKKQTLENIRKKLEE